VDEFGPLKTAHVLHMLDEFQVDAYTCPLFVLKRAFFVVYGSHCVASVTETVQFEMRIGRVEGPGSRASRPPRSAQTR